MSELIRNPVTDAILDRRSIRAYQPTALTPAQRDTLLEAALAAPSARNRQPCQTLLIEDDALLSRLNDDLSAYMRAEGADLPEDFCFYHRAPAFFLVTGDRSNAWSPVDGALAVENMALAAHSLGLGSCIIGMLRQYMATAPGRAWLDRLGVPADHDFVLGITAGVPAQTPDAKPRNRENIRRL